MAEKQKRDWKEMVAQSDGRMKFCPDKHIEALKEWNKSRLELSTLANEASKKELSTRLALENLIYEFRKYFDENGVQNVWMKDIGIEMNAMNEGISIITINDPIGNR